MNKLTTRAVQEIKASQGMYKASDVARAYECHRSTVTRIWDGAVHTNVTPAQEPPNVTSKNRPADLADDINLLLNRGLSPEAVATQLGIGRASVYAYRGVFV